MDAAAKPPSAPRPPTSVALLALIALLFFLSGATGLVYEVVWVRMFTWVFGSTTYAVSAVLTAFMAGLALGSVWIGRFVDRHGRHFLLYAALELGICLTGLAMPWGVARLESIYTSLFRTLPDSDWLLMAVKVTCSFLLLLLPTFFMGGTLPVLAKVLVARLADSSRRVGLLYAVNTLGATAGCFLTGFVLLERFGVRSTIHLIAAVNLLLAVIFAVLGLTVRTGVAVAVPETPAAPAPARTASPGPTADPAPRPVGLLLVAFLLAGFVALSLEVLWTRLLVFKLRTTIYAFSIMLTTFLGGIGLGSLLLSSTEPLLRLRNHDRAFGVLELLIGLFGLLSIPLFGSLEAIAQWWNAVTWEEKSVQMLVMSAFIMLPPTLLMGMTFPLVNRACTLHLDRVGSTVGRVYSANTVGSILGSFLTGFVLVQWLGTQRCLVVMSVLALGVGTLVLVPRVPGRTGLLASTRVARGLVLGAWVVAGGVALATPSDLLFRYFNVGAEETDSKVEILYANEGVECITTVHRFSNGERVIRTGSIGVAGTGLTLRTTQMMQAHVPMLLHPNPRKVLQVGFGSGETAHILTSYDTEQVHLAEISQSVLDTSARFFADINFGVVEHPKFRPVIMDGSNYVAMTDERYDVILNDSIWPFYAGNSSLYTKEYFEDGRDHLNPGGMMTSWLPLLMPDESLASLLATFHEVFPHVSLWMAMTHRNQHALIVGSVDPLEIDAATFLDRFERFAREDLALIELDDPVLMLECFKVDESGLGAWVDGVPLHTIDHPVLEFSPRLPLTDTDLEVAYERILDNARSVRPHLTGLEALGAQGTTLLARLQQTEEASTLVMRGVVKKETGQGDGMALIERAAEIMPDHPGAVYFLSQRRFLQSGDLLSNYPIEGSSFADLSWLGNELIKAQAWDRAQLVFEKALELDPDSAAAHASLGVALEAQGRLPQAIASYERAVRADPEDARAHHRLGVALTKRREWDRAVTHLEEALRIGPEIAETHFHLAVAKVGLNRFDDSIGHLKDALRVRPDYPDAHFNLARALTNLGQPEEAIGHYRAGLASQPDHAEAHRLLGLLLRQQGDEDGAREHLAEARRLREEASGPDGN